MVLGHSSPVSLRVLTNDSHSSTCLNDVSFTAYLLRVMGKLEPILANVGNKAGYTHDKMAIYRANTERSNRSHSHLQLQTFTPHHSFTFSRTDNLEYALDLIHVLNCGRKLTHAQTYACKNPMHYA